MPECIELFNGAPTDYTTTSWNDPNVWDLHRPEILPYPEDSNRRSHHQQNTVDISSTDEAPKIDERKMKSGKPELMNMDATNRECQIYPDEMRYRMLHENPATVCMWFFIRQMINMEVMRRRSYPVAYTKWYARKFEFQERGSVHEHNVKALVFLWIKAEHEGKPVKDLSESDFEDMVCRTDKLSMYCESGMVRQIMIRRIFNQIKKHANSEATPSHLKPKLQILQKKFQDLKDWIENVDNELERIARKVGRSKGEPSLDITTRHDNIAVCIAMATLCYRTCLTVIVILRSVAAVV